MQHNSIQSTLPQLEPTNHGKPQCSDIAINEAKASQTKPQAWSKLVDGQECWYYNYPGAVAEAAYLCSIGMNVRIPTIDEWMEILRQVEGNAEQKASALGTPLAGIRCASDSEFYGVGEVAFLVSSSPYGDVGVRYACLLRGFAGANGNWGGREGGFSVRFLSDNV